MRVKNSWMNGVKDMLSRSLQVYPFTMIMIWSKILRTATQTTITSINLTKVLTIFIKELSFNKGQSHYPARCSKIWAEMIRICHNNMNAKTFSEVVQMVS
jgi:hypothetical protein